MDQLTLSPPYAWGRWGGVYSNHHRNLPIYSTKIIHKYVEELRTIAF